MIREDREVERFLHVGGVVVFDPEPSRETGARFRTLIRGWDKAAFIILDRPKERERLTPLREGMPCVVRMLQDGEACAFSTAIMDCTNKPGLNWCRIVWPNSVYVTPIRKHKRVAVNLACRVEVDQEHAATAEICDLSVGGAGLKTTLDLCAGATVTLEFALSEGGPLQRVRALVRNVRPAVDGAVFAGCEFCPGQDQAQSDIALFETDLLKRGEENSPGAYRALVVDADALRGETICAEFRQRGWEALDASNTVEAFSRLYVLRPQVLLVNQRQGDLPGLDILRAVKGSRCFDSLCMFLYGAPEAMKQQAIDAGARVCFSESTDLSAITEHVVTTAAEVLQEAGQGS